MLLEYFQMIDRIEEIDADAGTLRAVSTVPDESPVFEGHFPGMPLVPGVLLIETMAQAGGFLTMASLRFSQMCLLVAADSAKMRGLVEPGTALTVEAELEHEGSGFSKAKGRILSEGKRLADAKLTFKTIAFPDERFAAMIRSRAQELGMPRPLLSA